MSSSIKLDDFVVYPVNKKLVDLFWGEGWRNRARFRWDGQAWEVKAKTHHLPKGFIHALELYRKGN